MLTVPGVERLALVTGAEIASTFDNPDQVQLGHADVIEEVIIGEDTLLRFSGVTKGEGLFPFVRIVIQKLNRIQLALSFSEALQNSCWTRLSDLSTTLSPSCHKQSRSPRSPLVVDVPR
jgi:hypothetical protein